MLLLATVEHLISAAFYFCCIYWYFNIGYSVLNFRMRLFVALILILTYIIQYGTVFDTVIAYWYGFCNCVDTIINIIKSLFFIRVQCLILFVWYRLILFVFDTVLVLIRSLLYIVQ